MKSQKKNDPIKITSPKIGVSPEQLTTYLVDLDKVKLFEAEINNLPLFASFFLLFLGLFIERIITQSIDEVAVLLILISVILGGFTYRAYKRKTGAWNKLEEEKINLYEGLKEER